MLHSSQEVASTPHQMSFFLEEKLRWLPVFTVSCRESLRQDEWLAALQCRPSLVDFAYYSPCWQYRRCKDRVDLVSLLPKCVSLFWAWNDTVDGCWWAVGYIYIYRWLQIIDAYLNLNFFFGGLWVDLPFVPFLCMGSLGYLGPRLAWLLMWDFRLGGVEKSRNIVSPWYFHGFHAIAIDMTQ